MGLTPQQRHDFEIYVVTRTPRLMQTAYLLTGHRADAEDLVQITLAKAYLAWGRIRDRAAVDAYVRRTLVTTHISLWRRRKLDEIPTEHLPEVAGPDFTTAVDLRIDLQESLWSLLADLPKRQRAVVVLRYFEDLSEAEAAAALGCSLGTIKSQSSKALTKLRAALVSRDSELLTDRRVDITPQTATGGSP